MNLVSFPYILENLSLYNPSIVGIIVWIILGIGFFIFIRMGFLYGYGFFLMREDAAALAGRKKTLGDLILMKDIQTELEKEIEQAILKATFQG